MSFNDQIYKYLKVIQNRKQLMKSSQQKKTKFSLNKDDIPILQQMKPVQKKHKDHQQSSQSQQQSQKKQNQPTNQLSQPNPQSPYLLPNFHKKKSYRRQQDQKLSPKKNHIKDGSSKQQDTNLNKILVKLIKRILIDKNVNICLEVDKKLRLKIKNINHRIGCNQIRNDYEVLSQQQLIDLDDTFQRSYKTEAKKNQSIIVRQSYFPEIKQIFQFLLDFFIVFVNNKTWDGEQMNIQDFDSFIFPRSTDQQFQYLRKCLLIGGLNHVCFNFFRSLILLCYRCKDYFQYAFKSDQPFYKELLKNVDIDKLLQIVLKQIKKISKYKEKQNSQKNINKQLKGPLFAPVLDQCSTWARRWLMSKKQFFFSQQSLMLHNFEMIKYKAYKIGKTPTININPQFKQLTLKKIMLKGKFRKPEDSSISSKKIKNVKKIDLQMIKKKYELTDKSYLQLYECLQYKQNNLKIKIDSSGNFIFESKTENGISEILDEFKNQFYIQGHDLIYTCFHEGHLGRQVDFSKIINIPSMKQKLKGQTSDVQYITYPYPAEVYNQHPKASKIIYANIYPTGVILLINDQHLSESIQCFDFIRKEIQKTLNNEIEEIKQGSQLQQFFWIYSKTGGDYKTQFQKYWQSKGLQNGFKIYSKDPLKKNQNKVTQNLYKQSSLTILSWNLWIQDDQTYEEYEKRYKVIIRQIKNKNADIICLQQVHKKLLNQYLKNDLKEYQSSYNEQRKTSILTKFKTNCFYEIKFDQIKNVGGNILEMYEFQIMSQNKKEKLKIAIISVHLKASFQNVWFRQKQINIINKLCTDFDITFLVGDFNIGQTEKYIKENQQLKNNKYMDLIDTFSDKFQTFLTKKSKFKNQRFDRILVKNNLKLPMEKFKKIVLLKDVDPIGDWAVDKGQVHYDVIKDGIVRSPSDHIGIYAKLQFNLQHLIQKS